jgi:PAS domain S-box-containing protein
VAVATPIGDPAGSDWSRVTAMSSDAPDRIRQDHGSAFFQGMVDETGVGVAAYRSDGRYDYVNDAFADLLGTTRDAIVGQPIWSVNPRFDRERFDAYWDSFGAGETQTAETVLERTDGETIPVQTTTTQAEIGDRVYHFGTIQDISERKRQERSLSALLATTREFMEAEDQDAVAERAVETARTVLDQSTTGVWLYDEDADRLSPVAATASAEELFESVPPYERGEGLTWRAFEQGEAVVYDDVQTHPARYNPDTPIRSQISLPLGSYGVMNIGSTEPAAFDDVDVSLAELLAVNLEGALERAQREDTLRDQRRELAHQNERLEEFAGIVSHDLRNPLNLARGKLQLALRTGDTQHLEDADDALDRMEGLIERTLSLARQGQIIGERTTVSLDEVARACWHTTETPESSLEIVEPVEVSADEERLSQLLENLFHNAIEHAGESATIRVGPLDGGFFVEDDGPGIPSSDRVSVFEAGFSTAEGGNGLGLSIVSLIADAHGWSIEIADSEEGGARFELRFEEESGSP